MTQKLEQKIIELIATDRLYIPLSSLDGKLKRKKPKIAEQINLSEYNRNFIGERVYARIEAEDKNKARKMSDAISEFSKAYPKYGNVLNKMIKEKRNETETHLYFGMNSKCKLTADDYMSVMTSLGFTEHSARRIYPELMEFSRKLSQKRNEERSILIGKTEDED